MFYEKLPREFYLRDTILVARELLGKMLVHETSKGRLTGRIVETEAYVGAADKGSHSFGGRRTNRNEAMYGLGGTAYVYLIYGMHHCFNIVTEEPNNPCAVLVRAVEPVDGLMLLSWNRFSKPYTSLSSHQQINLTNGPGKLCQAMAITKNQNKVDLCGDILYLCYANRECPDVKISSSPRINIDYAEEYTHKPWRFYISGSSYVSKK